MYLCTVNNIVAYDSNGYMTKYTYSATGQKLAVGHFVALPNVTWEFGVKPNTSNHTAIFAGHTDYLLGGSLIVQEGTTRMLLFDGGYAKAERTGSNSTSYGYTLFYYTQDHLGNNREVISANGALKQKTNYYPFGAIITDISSSQDFQPYKYNGKELDLMHGLNTYDYGARQYYSILGRWDRVDPLCEKYYSLSPYNYCGGNPVKFIDSDGREVINKFDQNKTCEKTATDIYVNNVNDLNNSIIVFAHGVGDGSGIALCDNDKIGTPFTFEMFLENNSETWNNRFVSGDNLKIVLFSCGTGIEGKFAQMISMDEAFKNISIIAPSDDITIYKNGTSSIDNGKPWVEYTNGELTNEYNGNLLPGTEEFEVSTYWEKTDINRYNWK